MILRILLLAFVGAMLLPPSAARMDMGTFANNFENECFKNDDSEPFRVLGQDTPLSSTMDNFIAMAEKFEAANPNVDLKDELNFFVLEYLFENIKVTNGKVSERIIERCDLSTIYSLWDPEKPGQYLPEVNDPFLPSEKCSLYFMISHSILEKDTAAISMRSNGNYSFRPDLNVDDYYPQELGVVAIRETNAAVQLSKVLLGLLVGLKNDRISQVDSFPIHIKNPQNQERLKQTVDSLYATTIAEILMLSSWVGFERGGLCENGDWVSIPLNNVNIEDFCPMVLKQEVPRGKTLLPSYSFSSIRGAADGLILGLIVRNIYNSDVKLSQILRMYYSPRGIILDNNVEDINDKRVSFCNRESLIQPLEQKIEEQMISYGYLVAVQEADVDGTLKKSRTQYDDNKNAIYQTRESYAACMQSTSLEKPEELTPETFLDIIVVMDSSNAEKSFVDQQLITGYLAKQLDLMYSGSRITILLDQKISSASGTSSKIELKPIVNETYSSSCAACTVGQIGYETSTVPREEVIIAVDQLLQEIKENETSFNGVNGKVVIYFNYENDDGRTNNNKVQSRVDKALRDLNIRHLDVLLYAVGLDPEVLKKYARNDPSLVFLGTEDKPKEVADKILKKISYAPTLLQYSDCVLARSEKSAIFETFVSPNKLQHYTMPAEYFYKSYNAKILFESQNGLVRVCYNRGTMKPENEAKYCKDTTPSTGVEFKVSNPCKGFTKESCSPLYFAVMGIDPTDTNGNQAQRQKTACKTNDRLCSTLDQIKIRVSHEGIRCSGCLGLGAPPAVILFTVLLTFFLYKRF